MEPAHSLPEILTFFATVGLGIGLGIGSGYIAFLKRVTPARIEAEKAFDDAHRATNFGKLEECLERNNRYEARLKECHERQDACEEDVRNLRIDLEAERRRAEKAVEDLTVFATGILRARGYIHDSAAEALKTAAVELEGTAENLAAAAADIESNPEPDSEPDPEKAA